MSFPSTVQFDQDGSRLFDYDDTSTLGDSIRSFGGENHKDIVHTNRRRPKITRQDACKNYKDIFHTNRRRPKITRQDACSDDLDEMKLILSRASAGNRISPAEYPQRPPRRKRRGGVTKTLEEALACLDGSRNDSPTPAPHSRRWNEKLDSDNINYERRSNTNVESRHRRTSGSSILPQTPKRQNSRNVESRHRRISGSSILPQTPKRQLSSDRLILPKESNTKVSSSQANPDFLGFLSKQTNQKIGSYATLRRPPQRQASRTVYMQQARRT